MVYIISGRWSPSFETNFKKQQKHDIFVQCFFFFFPTVSQLGTDRTRVYFFQGKGVLRCASSYDMVHVICG